MLKHMRFIHAPESNLLPRLREGTHPVYIAPQTHVRGTRKWLVFHDRASRIARLALASVNCSYKNER